ncbi:MAG TPA: hypothetical protein VHC95_13410 [Opitutales bacterium]|nr:hypothetical protein [Opitutales bacterium]
MADVRIARKQFLKGLGVAAAACVAGPARAMASPAPAAGASKVATADLPFKVRPAAKIVARRADTV